MTKFNEQDQRDLSKALSYANWALLGILVPFLGWLLAAMSLSFVKIIPVNKQSRDRINQVRNAAWLAIALSTISFAIGAVIYYRATIDTNSQTQQTSENKYKECIDNRLNDYSVQGDYNTAVAQCDWAKPN